MKELWNDFWTDRSAAVRGLRVILVVAGAVFAAITPALGLPPATMESPFQGSEPRAGPVLVEA